MSPSERIIFGSWDGDDLRRAFVEGVAWWEYVKTGGTIWSADRERAEDEAERRFPGGKARPWRRLPASSDEARP